MEWEEVYNEGVEFARSFERSYQGGKLTPEVLYQMACIACEGMLTGVMLKNNIDLEHSSVSVMLKLLNAKIPVDPQLIKDSFFLNRFYNVCNPFFENLILPKPEDIDRIAKLVVDVEITCKKVLEMKIAV